MDYIDLKAQQKRLGQTLHNRINAVLHHGQYIMGPEVRELEKNLEAFSGARSVIGCASGTNALDLVLKALQIGPGDVVFTTAFSFIATAESIAATGAIPVFVDIDPLSYNIDADALTLAIEAVNTQDARVYPVPPQVITQKMRARAILAVDLFGYPADYDRLLALAAQHELMVLEDGAQAFGGQYQGKALCNCGCHAATTSFFPAKPLGCYGDGGAVFTNDLALASMLDSLRYHGRASATDKNDNVRLGTNGRLDTLQAAILLAKLEIFPDEMHARQVVARRYQALLQTLP
ncbi:MAG: DegT/DnrJ/EryC1/StrS family aminotransferase, partial [Desulfovibrionaceae bacterium]